MFDKNMTDIVKDLLIPYIKEGDTVVDATMGNGYDTLFLAQKVGAKGKVYSFDVQINAIESTRQRLHSHNLGNRIGDCVHLILESHSCMKAYIQEDVKAMMFNLGYLPNGDKDLVTKKASTLEAIGQALDLLKSKGIISLLSYYGHPGGREELEGIEEYLQSLDVKLYHVMSLRNDNRKNAPILFLIYKK